ncbi:MAG: radical SAM protein [Proteobacteria bacterium]|nr:radical SAM protein [Pseudomonadota bacterium]MDA1133223.1 radical SAM protein [Pseudomonadota bacterium]
MDALTTKPSPDANRRQRTDLLLVYPPWPVLDDRAMLQNSLPPLGILSVAAHAESKGYSVHVIDVHGERADEETVRQRIREHRPRFIGISVLTNMCVPAHRLARISKEESPDCVVVAGGVHAEAMPDRMLRNSAIDCVVRGDGEEPMIAIMEGLDFKSIDGISYREGQFVVHNKARQLLMDLDRFPFPAYHLVDFANYFPPVGSYRDLPAINMLMTRGCPGKCTFCNSARTTLRARNAHQVVAQIKHLREVYGIRQIMFYDDTFTVLKKTCLEFCAALAAEKLDVSWVAYVRGDCFSDDLAAAMRKAGCHQVLMGIETGSEQIALRIGKPIARERYMEAVAIAHRNGLEVRGSFIIGNMGETWQTMMETLNFAIELDVDLFQLSVSTPYPGTALYKEAREAGTLKECSWYEFGQGKVLVEQPQITDEEIYRFERYAFRKFYLRPIVAVRMLRRLTRWRHVRDYFVTAMILLLGRHKKNDSRNWESWKGLREEDYLDLPITEPESVPLTYQLRQAQ